MTSEGRGEDLVSQYAIHVDGEDRTSALRGRVISIAVREDLDLLGWFEILLTPEDESIQTIPPGSRIEIWLGHGGGLGLATIGEVTGIQLEKGRRTGTRIRIRGLDPLHRLARGRRTRSFRDSRTSDVVAEVARERGLRAEVQETASVHPSLLQANESDYAFIRRLAASVGFEIFWRDDRIVFRSPVSDEDVRLSLSGARQIESVRLDLSTARQVGSVEVRGWDPRTKEAIVGTAGPRDVYPRMGGKRSGPEMSHQATGPSVRVYAHESISHQEEADEIARRMLCRIALETVGGEIRVAGDPALRVGRLLEINDVDEEFDGTFYLAGVTHTMDARRGYRSLLRVRRNSAGPRPEATVREVVSGKPMSEDATPAPSEFRVLDPSGKPLADRLIFLTLPDGRRIEGRTDGRGAVAWPAEAASGSLEVEIPSLRPSPLSPVGPESE
ncbi:MAG: contractile injection system protein, VgrG/Pvc8 family [Planctomycetota bacterium]|nr:contractile injection system protein, VgrG/Pvc8 family [Planctomycetota bacterium]